MLLPLHLYATARQILASRTRLMPSGCIEFTRGVGGYGQVRVPGQSWSAHRLSWVLNYGPIAPGMYVCHRCDNKRCVRPDHLFIGTAKDNNQDMARKGRVRNDNQGRTHCRRGHEFTKGNFYVRKEGGRCCLVCDRLKHSGKRGPSVWAKSEVA